MKILITGAGSVMGQSIYGALALHEFSGPVEVHFANSDELGAGRYFDDPRLPVVSRPIFPLANDEAYEEAVLTYMQKHAIDIGYAGTQHELTKLAGLRDAYGNWATLSKRAAEICIDKNLCLGILGAAGIRVPRSQLLSDFMNSPQFSGPAIMKPNASSASRSILFFDDISEVPPSEIATRRADDTIVQERLIGEEFTCGCYLDRYSRSVSIISMVRTLTPDGATAYGRIVVDEEVEAYVASVARALQNNGFDFGHINVQLIKTSGGPCLFEVNGRLSSTEAPKAKFGFNSTAAFIANIVEEKPYLGFKPATEGQFLRYYKEVYW